MKRSIFIYFVVLAVLWTSGIILYLRYWDKVNDEYIKVELSLEVNGIVTEIMKRKGTCYFKVDNVKLYIPSSINYSYMEESLVDNLMDGDSISKLANCDTIHIFKENKHLYFIIGESINWGNR